MLHVDIGDERREGVVVRRDGPDVLTGLGGGLIEESLLGAGRPSHHQHHAISKVPSLPRQLVRRQRLMDVLDEDVPMTAVIAPAGTGKTTLIAEWAAEAGRPVAWLGRDALAGGPVCFWVAVVDALERLTGAGSAARLEILRQQAPIGDVVLHLLNELGEAPSAPGTLVLDDIQEIDDEVVGTSLSLFLRHLPDHLRVVLASRREPNLPLERMRAGGDLIEIRFSELCFSLQESFELLQLLAPAVPVEDVRAVAASADGWAAALRLASIGMRVNQSRPPGSAASEPDQLIADYIHHEVLGGESDDVVQFLRDLSIVDRFTVEMAAAITGRPDAGELVAQAEARGLFVRHVSVYGWYEIHSLLRSVLQNEARHQDPSRTADLRRRAAEWLERDGETLAALDQWLLAGAHREVLRLLAVHHVALYDTGREATIREIVAKLAPETTAADLGTLLDLGWCQLLTSRAAFLDCIDQAEWWAANREVSDGALVSMLETLRAISCLIRGDWPLARELARAGVQHLDAWWEDPVGRTGWNNVGRAIALSERWHDSNDEVRELSVTLRRDPNRLMVHEATRALGEALAGRPVDALRVAAGVRASTALANLVMSRSEVALAEAIAHREIADFSDVASELAALVALPIEPLTYARGFAALELVQMHLDLGDLPAAEGAFVDLDAVVRSELPAMGGRTLLGRMGTALLLAKGDTDAAATWAKEVEDPFWGPVSHARVELGRGDRRAAADALGEAAPRSSRHEVVLALLRARAVDDHDTASMWAGQAATQACAEGMLQTVASEDCLDLIEHVAWRVPAQWMDRLRRLAAASRQAGGVSSLHLIEPLTARERDVLRFLPSRLTLGEIADELYVSVNTLKFHLKLIYRKLGVNSRAQASEYARSWARGRGDHG